jgi:tetratricopeptide (TPR) repeat protein
MPETPLRRLLNSPTFYIGLAAWVALALPPLLFGPWLPLLDLVAFVGLDALPAQHSFGPLHYGVFQFTYIVHYALSRVMLALGLSAPAHIVLFYFLQGGVFFFVIWRLLPRLVPERWLAGVATAAGALAFWDGFFLWGGPLPFSLGGTALAAAMFAALREAAAPEKCDRLLVPLLLVIAVMCHPFALLFALLLVGVRTLLVPARRWQSVALGAGLLLLGWIIRQDSPESGAAAGLTSLFTWNLTQVPRRLLELFLVSSDFAVQLFGHCPAGLKVYFWFLGAVHLLGFLTAPVVAVVARDNRPLRLLATLHCAVAAVYLCSVQNDAVIPGWPWRILTLHNALLYLAGVACPLYLIRRGRPALLAWTTNLPRAAWAAPILAATAVFLIQIPLLRLGDAVGRGYERTRASILQSGIANAFVVVTDIDAIQPFYLRCVPFLLFSDPQLVARNLILYTEWHIQNRHPTRLTESWIDLGRTAYQAAFFTGPKGIDVRVVPQPAGQIPLAVGNNQWERGGKPDLALLQFHQANYLISAGCLRDAILRYEAALRLAPGFAEAHNNLGVALLSSGRLPEAQQRFTAALQAKPDYADARANLGAVLLRNGQVAEAREQFQLALRLNPQQAVALAGLKQASSP